MIQHHGGNIFQQEIQYDFSANLNPLGIPESMKQAVIESADLWEKYPDPDCSALVKKLSADERIPENQIICGNGADDLIYRIIQGYRPESALLCVPSFGEYEKALKENRCRINYYFLKERDEFSLTEGFLTELNQEIDILFLCTPNNPTGKLIDADLMKKIADACQKYQILLICDECFLEFTEHAGSIKKYIHAHMIILKAFTKIYAIPGLRLGYALCGSPELADLVKHTGQYWSVSIPAQIAGLNVPEAEYFNRTLDLIQQERAYLESELRKLKIKFFKSDANFILLKSVPELDDLLLKQKILIRNCESYPGLEKGYFRIAVRTHEENEILISALRRCLHE